ncbi:MAG: hypothetical protein GXP25_07970 [Planctomycetes bacterium]|nr:hypothetical protein [Planctomycetota bacterium]
MTVLAKLAFPFFAVVLPLFLGAMIGHRIPERDRWSQRLVFASLVVGYPPVTFLAGWSLHLEWDLIWLPVAGMVISLMGLGIGWILSRFHAWKDPRSRGAYIFGVGLNNMGNTGGSLVAFALLGEQAFAQATLVVLHWQFLIYLICFPLAKGWAGELKTLSLRDEFVAALRDPRLLPLAGLLLGLLVNIAGVDRPDALRPVTAIGMALTAFAAAFAVGISVRTEKLADYKPLYVSQFVGKFLLLPAVTWVLCMAAGLSPMVVKICLIQASCPQAFYAVFLVHFFHLDQHQANSMFIINSLLYLVFVLPLLVWLL